MTRTAVRITTGVRKAERFPVSRKRKPGLPAHRPVDNNRLTRNERAYYDACLEAWESISEETIREQFLFPTQRQSGDEIRSDLAAIQPFLGDITLFQLEQSGALMFNEIKTAVAADWARLEKAVTDTPSEFATSMRFNRASPNATAYASLSAANMVTDMVDSQVTAVRSVIEQAYRSGLTQGKVSSKLVTLLNEMPSPRRIPAGLAGTATIFGDATRGLTNRYAVAVYHRAEKLMRDHPNMKPHQLKKRVNAYGKRLQRSRARTIARTEIMRAANQGRLQGMWQAADRGLVNPTLAKKQWVTSRFDVCPICVPLHGQAIGIRESFGPMGQAPPAHPNCRCTIRSLPDPLTFGIPRSSGTGQTDQPLRFVRPERPGVKIEDLIISPGVVAEPGALIGQPGSRTSLADDIPTALAPETVSGVPTAVTPVTRTGNVSSEIKLYGNKNKRAREVFDPVIEQMDDAGIVLPSMQRGPTEVQLVGTTKQNGMFKPQAQTERPKLRLPKDEPSYFSQNPDGSFKYMRRTEDGKGWTTPPELRDRYDADWAEWYQLKLQAEEAFNERFDEWMTTGGVVKSRIQVSKKVRTAKSAEKIIMSGESQRNTLVHEIGHRADFSDDLLGYRTEELVKRVKAQVDMPSSGNLFDIDALDLPAADRDLWRFLQTAANSDTMARLKRNVLRAADRNPNLDAEAYIAYLEEPVELWARSFNQWFSTRYGDADMVADMGESAASWGYQWRQAEFDEEIAPLVEKVLRGWGVIE